MKRYKWLAIALVMGVCLSCTACSNRRDSLYEKFDGVSEREGDVVVPVMSDGEGAANEVEDLPLNYDTVGGGVSVFAAQDVYETYEDSVTWYPNKDVFLADYGFADKDPFYRYYNPEGSLLMTLYYDENSEVGCGLRYYPYENEVFPEGDGIFGFTFQGTTLSDWTGFMIEDYMALTSVYGGTGSQSVKDYEENTEYDEEGRIVSFETKGIVTELEEKGVTGPDTILAMEFTYHENGNLKRRVYEHNGHIFPMGMNSLESQFDEMGRLVYEQSSVSHGSVDTYYIYEDETDIPMYCLTLDYMDGAWIPSFAEYYVAEVVFE